MVVVVVVVMMMMMMMMTAVIMTVIMDMVHLLLHRPWQQVDQYQIHKQ